VNIEFDDAKSRRNARKRGLPFDRAAEFEWETALIVEDTRKRYPERRFEAIGYIEQRLYVMVFAGIAGGVRVISFRKANRREEMRYAAKTGP
jgi:uncharacterized protein